MPFYRRFPALACALSLATFHGPTSALAQHALPQSDDAGLESLVGGDAHAARTREDAPSTAQEDELKRLFKEASARYSASDYRGAIEGFVRVLTLLESEGGDARVRGAILFNLGQAYERAFETERQIRYLRLARDTYNRYIREAEQGFSYDDVPTVQVRLTQVQASLAQLDNGAPTPLTDPEHPESAQSAPASTTLAPQPQRQVAANVHANDSYRKARNLRTTGIIVASVGAGFTAVGILMAWYTANFAKYNEDLRLSDIDEYNAQGRTAQAMGITGLALGLGGLAAGIPLWIIGHKRAKAARNGHHATQALRWGQGLNIGVVPQAGGARLGVSGRF